MAEDSTDGSSELGQLAELLRLGAETGRKIARVRSAQEARRIEALCQQAETMADELDDIVRMPDRH